MGNIFDICLNYFEEFYEYPVKNIRVDQSYYYKDNIIEELIQCEWKKEILDKFLKNFVKEQEIPFGLIGKPLRLILTKRLTSPSITFVMEVMGKKEVIKRLKDIW